MSLMSTQTRAFMKGKLAVSQNEKLNKLIGFSFYINIAFEAYC